MDNNLNSTMIHKITPFEDYNQWLKYFGTGLNGPINQNKKVAKVVMPIIIKLWGLVFIKLPLSCEDHIPFPLYSLVV